MFDLPKELRSVMAVVLCIDSPSIEEPIFIYVLGPNAIDLLDDAVSRSLLSVESVGEADNKTAPFYRIDENTRELATSAIFADKPESENRDDWHQKIGRRLIRSGCHTQIAIDQFLLAKNSILESASEDTCYAIADVCLRTGTEAAKERNFQLATKNLNFGVQVISRCPRHWKHMYDLSLSLYQAQCEANQGATDYDKAMEAIQAVKTHSRSFHDTLVVRASEIVILGSKARRKEAIRKGIEVLSELNHPLPQHRKKYHTVLKLRKLRRRLRGKSNEMILRMPDMIDEVVGHRMKILELLFTISFSEDGVMLLLIVVEMVQLTIDNGLCNLSAPAFATFGMLLGAMGETEDGVLYSKLALELYNRFPVREWLPRTYLAVYGGIFSTINTQEAKDALMQAHRVALETGDIEIAFITAHAYVYTLVILGYPFPEIQKRATAFLEEAKKRNQATMTKIFSISVQLFENIAGNTADASVMAGPYFDEFDKKDGMTSLSSPIILSFFHMCKMMLAYLVGDYPLAMKYAKLCDGIEKHRSGFIGYVNASMYHSLARIAHCRGTGRDLRRTNRRVFIHREKFKKFALVQPGVCSGKLFLIDAELSWLNNRNDALFHFKNAINCAANERRLNDAALANERLAMYLLEKDDEEFVKYLAAAKDAYQRAGVGLKVKQLDRMIQSQVKSANQILSVCRELSNRLPKHEQSEERLL